VRAGHELGGTTAIDATATDSSSTSADTTGARRLPMALATWMLIALVLLVIVVLLIVKLTRGAATVPSPPVAPAPAGVVRATTSVPSAVFDAVAAPGPSIVQPPQMLGGQPDLRLAGKPAVVYVGAEFCPYCAAERWALVVALSRFGTFSHLGATASSEDQVFSEIPTFSLDGARYTSRYLSWSGVEEYGAAPSATAPAGYPRLHHPTGLQAQLQQRYGRSTSGGMRTLPFVDIANRAVAVGASAGYSPSVLQGLSMGQIAGDLSDPHSPVSQAVVGYANEIVAVLCEATGGQPARVCSATGTAAGRGQLGLPEATGANRPASS
jgi:Domain of unknown function (DUF929)